MRMASLEPVPCSSSQAIMMQNAEQQQLPSPSQSQQPTLRPDLGVRVKGCTIVKPIVIGNVATPFSKKRESDGHTHMWTIYIRPYLNEDYSRFIKKVQFKLHDSYEEPKRVVSQPPFEVSETGWGEFEIPIKIFFADPNERPVTVHHALKLFQNTDGTECQALHFTEKKKTVTAESYDEIIFHEPTKYLKTLLENVPPLVTDGEYKHDTDFEANIEESKNKINVAKQLVRAEIEELKNKLKLSRDTMKLFQAKLDEASGTSDKGKRKRTKSGPKKLTKEPF